MRGHPEFNAPAFAAAAADLRAVGHEVFSPAEHSVKLFGEAVRKSAAGDEGRMGGDEMTIGIAQVAARPRQPMTGSNVDDANAAKKAPSPTGAIIMLDRNVR